jgi:hypothetical protein
MAIERYRSGPRPVYGRAAGDRNRPVPVDIGATMQKARLRAVWSEAGLEDSG